MKKQVYLIGATLIVFTILFFSFSDQVSNSPNDISSRKYAQAPEEELEYSCDTIPSNPIGYSEVITETPVVIDEENGYIEFRRDRVHTNTVWATSTENPCDTITTTENFPQTFICDDNDVLPGYPYYTPVCTNAYVLETRINNDGVTELVLQATRYPTFSRTIGIDQNDDGLFESLEGWEFDPNVEEIWTINYDSAGETLSSNFYCDDQEIYRIRSTTYEAYNRPGLSNGIHDIDDLYILMNSYEYFHQYCNDPCSCEEISEEV